MRRDTFPPAAAPLYNPASAGHDSCAQKMCVIPQDGLVVVLARPRVVSEIVGGKRAAHSGSRKSLRLLELLDATRELKPRTLGVTLLPTDVLAKAIIKEQLSI
eukprot:CAMPEP_0171131600 /NCGR_PEP_ID=MMETSP0766_2-20121228/123033_1 /TAXON_ID=439317 /ORGANISM="Gambierdiscus australes, Strain CAWD 149" /LENGTH=102 /DNA_ID=CAMNT_0011594909 /DNA_START=678 /DNA_END=984 /DNA_ORIENTATION=+